jgi:putative FmdB family regulatory protein
VPTYEYRCGKCGEAFEVVCSIAEREKKAVCPACGAREVDQVFGSIAFSGHRTEFSPGHFERAKGKQGGPPRWVEPKR